jgi:UDP-glucuronate 4-epimerase
LDSPPTGDPDWSGKRPDPSTSRAPYRIYNIGNNSPIKLMDFIEAIEKSLGKVPEKNFMPLQAGDVPATWANVEDLVKDLDYSPSTDISTGVNKFVKWYLDYYQRG